MSFNMDNYNYWNDPRVIEGMVNIDKSYGLTHSNGCVRPYCEEGIFDEDIFFVSKKGGDYYMTEYSQFDSDCHGEIIGILSDYDLDFDGLLNGFSHLADDSFEVLTLKKFESVFKSESIPRGQDFINKYNISISFKMEVCYQCGGRGSIVNPCIDAGGISMETFDEDPEFYHNYMSGRFDQTCNVCNGKNVVQVIDWPNVQEYVYVNGENVLNECYRKSLSNIILQHWAQAISSYEEGCYDSARESAWERAMGCQLRLERVILEEESFYFLLLFLCVYTFIAPKGCNKVILKSYHFAFAYTYRYVILYISEEQVLWIEVLLSMLVLVNEYALCTAMMWCYRL